ncbi:hypothetical protein ACFL05_00255 [Patescibacteria group bacterium]
MTAENLSTYYDIKSYFLKLQVKVFKNPGILGIATNVSKEVFDNFLFSFGRASDFSWKKK